MERLITIGAALSAGLLALLPGQIMAQTATPGGSIAVTIAADLDPGRTMGIMPEGLIADARGRLYTSDTASKSLYRVSADNGGVRALGTLPATSLGMAFDGAGNLYFASGASVLKLGADKLEANQIATSDVVTFTTGVPQANGLIFDSRGNLYVSGASTGTIYVVTPDGKSKVFAEGFTSERKSQPISTNGLGFGLDGRLYSANTGSGEIDRIPVNPDGTAGDIERWVKDPLLLGADGIAFAANDDLYVAANERNAIVKVTPDGKVSDVASNGNSGPLEFPASLAFSGNKLYASNFDIASAANAPNDPGIGGSIARLDVGVSGLSVAQAGASASATPTAQAAPASSGTPGSSPTPPATSAATSTPTVGNAASGIATTPTSVPAAEGGVPAFATPVAGSGGASLIPTPAPVGMPSTGGPESLLAPMLEALGGALIFAGILAHAARSRKRASVRVKRG